MIKFKLKYIGREWIINKGISKKDPRVLESRTTVVGNKHEDSNPERDDEITYFIYFIFKFLFNLSYFFVAQRRAIILSSSSFSFF